MESSFSNKQEWNINDYNIWLNNFSNDTTKNFTNLHP